MENEWRRIIVDSSMAKPSFLSGHTYDVSRPCTVYGTYCDRTGTLLFEYAWCDGTHFYAKNIDKDDLDRFYLELQSYLIEQDF